MLEMLIGISPQRWFMDKSRDSRFFNKPIFVGINPVKLFLDKFKTSNSVSLVIPSGTSPCNLLLERSIIFKSPKELSNTSSLPFHTNDIASSIYDLLEPNVKMRDSLLETDIAVKL
ncbi:hypothetical protein I3760_05G207200 [Carya illinoinensis]|nr:hypothetical protein I3760_05G207200 [Carya illinoinensis]